MKKQRTMPGMTKRERWTALVLFLLLAVLIISLAGNLLLWQRLTGQRELPLTGTFQTGSGSQGSCFLFRDGNYCLYTQQDGVLQQGTVSAKGAGLYTLLDDGGGEGYLLRSHDGVYFVGGGEDAVLYTQLGQFLAMPSIPGGYPEWCRQPQSTPDSR